MEYNDWYEGLNGVEKEYVDTGEYGKNYGKQNEVVSRLLNKRDELIERVEKQEAQLNKYQAKSLDNKLPTLGSKEYWEKEQKTALTALSLMKDVDEGSVAWNKAVAKLNEANSKLKTWDFSGKTATASNKLKSETADRLAVIQEAQNKIRQQEYQNEIDLQQQQINLMKEGAEKVRAQIALDYEKRLAEIAKQGEGMVKEQQKIERQTWEVQNPDWKKKGMTFTSSTTSVSQLSASQQKYLEDSVFLAGEERKKAKKKSTSNFSKNIRIMLISAKLLKKSLTKILQTCRHKEYLLPSMEILQWLTA